MSRFEEMEHTVFRKEIERLSQMQDELCRIGTLLTSETDLDSVLEIILSECRKITESDAGSLFIKEKVKEAPSKEGVIPEEHFVLRFVAAQNDSVMVPFRATTMSLSRRSIVGYTALTGETLNIEDAYLLPPGGDVEFDPSFDEKIGYRSKSFLAVPMKNPRGDIIGVIELINRKRNFGQRLDDPMLTDERVIGFSDKDVHLIHSLASQAAVAIERAQLYRSLENLLAGLVDSFNTALEERNKVTSGHSRRVAQYAMAIAQRINTIEEGPLARLHFSKEELRELKFAALLHDIGKIGVPEAILDKEHKLPDAHLMGIRYRFAYWQERLLQEEKGREEAEILRQDFEFLAKVNVPGYMKDEEVERVKAIAGKVIRDTDGSERPLLDYDEALNLSVQKGNLTPRERAAMEQHAAYSWEILKRIPWGKGLENLPLIASGHHERLDGSGYPHHLQGEEVPFGARILAIADFFDALTAYDRPYKRPVPVDKTLEILKEEVAAGHYDQDLAELFIREKLYSTTPPQPGG
jgi:HD-GYP domain-containing protein (c-di-GMP phosphodiesterase class II)